MKWSAVHQAISKASTSSGLNCTILPGMNGDWRVPAKAWDD
jgi:hypothetical protein